MKRLLLLSNLFLIFATQVSGQPCAAFAGTMTLVNDGGGTVPTVVCYGAQVQLIHNGDYVLPPPAPGNTAGVMLAIYSCPPTVEDLDADPCFTGWYWTGESFDNANLGQIQGSVGINTFWFAPVASDAVIMPISHDQDGDDCFDVNLTEAYEFTFLDEIMINVVNVDNCSGQVTLQITGGYPALFPGSYTVVNAGAGNMTQSGASGQNIVIDNLNNGDFYGINLLDDGNGCSASFSGGPINVASGDPTFTFPDFCEGASNGPSSITTPGGSFALNPPPGDGAGINTATGQISGATGGATYSVVYTTPGPCPTTSAPVLVNVLPAPPPPMVGSFFQACPGESLSIIPSGSGGTFNWYDNPGLGSPIFTGVPFDPSGIVTPGIVTPFYVTETNAAGCESPPVLFNVLVLNLGLPIVIPSAVTACSGTTITITPLSGNGQAPATFNFYSDPGLVTQLAAGPSFTFTTTVSQVIYITEDVSGCESDPVTFTVTIENPPPPPTISSQTICINEPIPLYTASGTGGTFNWYDSDPAIGSPVPIFSGNSFTPPVSSATPGTFNYWVTEVSTSNCEGMATPFTLMIQPGPGAPNTNNPMPICINNPAPTLLAFGVGGGTLSWYDQDPTSGGTPVGAGSSFIPVINTSIPGTFNFWVTETSTGGCEGAATMVSVVVNAPLPPPVVGPNEAICVNNQPPALTAAGQGGTLNWYDQDPTSGNIMPIGSGSPFVPPLNTSVPGTATYWVTDVDNTGCESLPAQILVTVNDFPASSFTTECASGLLTYSINLTTDANQVNSNFGTVTNHGGGSFTISNIPAGQAVVLTVRNTTTMCSELLNIPAPDCNCPTVPLPISLGDATICESEIIPPLNVTTEAGLVINWYDAPSDGTLLFSNSTTFTPTATGTYYAEAVDPETDCVSNGRTPVSLTINPDPTLQNSTLDCAADFLTYTVTLTITETDVLAVNFGIVTDNSGGNFTISGIDINTPLEVNASNSATGCSIDFSFNPPVCGCPTINAPVSDGDLSVCEGDILPELSVTVDPGMTVDWYDQATGGTLLLADATTFTPTTAGVYYAEARDPVNDCISSTRTAVTITVEQLPTLQEAFALCNDDILSYFVTLAMTNADSISVNAGTVTNEGFGNFIVEDIPIDSLFTFTAYDTISGCTIEYMLNIPNCDCPDVDPPVSLGDLSICEGDSIPTLSVEVDTGLVVDWYDMEMDGTLLLSDSTGFTPTAAGTYFAEARNPLNDCVSITRTAVNFSIDSLPVLLTSEALCAEDLTTYSVNLTMEHTDTLLLNTGILTINGNGSFSIENIPVDSTLAFSAIDTSACSRDFTIAPPSCDCPIIPAPVSNGDLSICGEDPIPAISAMPEPGLQVNWYDAPAGGTLLLGNSNVFLPSAGGTYYAENIDPVNGCASVRTPVTLTINPLPILTDVMTLCSDDILTYTAIITVENWEEVNFSLSEGTFSTQGNGVFTIAGISILNNLTINALHPNTLCGNTFTIEPPECECPNQNPPISEGDVAICEGVTFPSLNASAETDQTIDWYDAAIDGNLLAEGTFTFLPPSPGTYYAETRHLFNGCLSAIRTPITLTVNPLPTVSDTATLCAPDLLTYTLTITFNDADQIVASAGNVIDNGNGNFSILDIPTGTAVDIVATNTATTCSATFNFDSPICPCPPVELPLSNGDQEICAGDPLVALSVSTGVEQTVDWYDAPIGGNLLQSGSLTYLPTVPGIYFAEARNLINNCVQTTRLAVALIEHENPQLTVTNTTDPGCNLANGVIELEATQGSGPYTYAIGAGPFQTEPTFDNLDAGTFDFTVIDDNGCSNSTTGTLEPSEGVIADAGTALPLDCIRTNTDLDASNSFGDGEISFVWTLEGESIGIGPNINVDVPGAYVVHVTLDACVATDTVIVVDNAAEIIADIQGEGNLSCVINMVTLTAGGSTFGPDIVYEWQFAGNPIMGADQSTYEAGQAGWYALLVRDTTNGCEAIDSMELILDEAYPVANAGPDQQLDCDTEEVILDGSNSQSGPQIIYSWLGPNGETLSQGNIVSIAVNLPGTYTLVVTDTLNGCYNESTAEVIPDYTLPIADAGEEDHLDCRITELNLDGSGSSTGAVYSYQWMPIDTGNIVMGETGLTPLVDAPGNYALTVQNSENGCSATDTVFIEEITTFPTGFTVLTENPACIGDENGSLVILPEDQVIPYLYSLENAAFSTANQFSQLPPGNYELSAQDDFGCTWDTIVQILPGVDLHVELGDDEYIKLGDSLTLDALVNVPEDSINRITWTGQESLNCIDCLHPVAQPGLTTTYTITVSNTVGCTDSDDITIFVDRKRNIYIPNVFSPNGDGQNDRFYIHGGTDVVEIDDFYIFDRWGEIIFEKHGFSPNNPLDGWDGTFNNGRPLNTGVFVYMAKITFIDGQQEIYSGDVTLVK